MVMTACAPCAGPHLTEQQVLDFASGRTAEGGPDAVADVEHHLDRCDACLNLVAAASKALSVPGGGA